MRLHYALEQTRIITSTDYTVRFPKATGHSPEILRCNRLRINVTEKGLAEEPSQFSSPATVLLHIVAVDALNAVTLPKLQIRERKLQMR